MNKMIFAAKNINDKCSCQLKMWF